MIWLYRLQQRLSITRQESLAILTLLVLFLLGLTVRYAQRQQVPPLEVPAVAAETGERTAPDPSAVDAEASTAAPSSAAESRININTAPAARLQALPGIGPALSRRIERYRERRGSFRRVEDLERVRGIGPKTLAKLRPLISAAPPAAAPDSTASDAKGPDAKGPDAKGPDARATE